MKLNLNKQRKANRSPKWRSNYKIPYCIRNQECENKGEMCKSCVRFSEYKQKEGVNVRREE